MDALNVAARARHPWHAIRISQVELAGMAEFALNAAAALDEIAALAEEQLADGVILEARTVLDIMVRHRLYSKEILDAHQREAEGESQE